MRIFVTGASGFIGSHLVRRLYNDGAQVSVMIDADGLGNLTSLEIDLNKIYIFQGDLKEKAQIEQIIKNFSPTIIFHLGAVVDLERSYNVASKCLETNILGTLNLLESAKNADLDRFIFCSTSEVYGDGPVPYSETQLLQPVSPYAISKITGEMSCDYYYKLHRLPVVSLRLSTVYGPGQDERRFIPQTIISCLKNAELRLSSCIQERDFIYIQDAIEALIKATQETKAIGEIINIGSKDTYPLKNVVMKIKEMTKSSVEPNFGYYPDRPLEAKKWVSSVEKAKRILGWHSKVNLELGLGYTIDFYSKKLGIESKCPR